MRPDRRVLRLLSCVVTGLALSGCQGIGPATLAAGRGAYSDVIARTNAEQMLGLIVRMRYADPIALLAVSNVTANLRFNATTESQFGIGSQTNYAGNLVPFAAGVGYEDNPTISYAPIDEQAFLREWVAPVSLDILIPTLRDAAHPDDLLELLVDRMNGLRSGPASTPAERAAFIRAAKLLRDLRELGIASWVVDEGISGRYELILAGYAPEHAQEVDELLRLLDMRPPKTGGVIRIPVALGLRAAGLSGLVIQTRSVGEILHDAARAVEVPAEHLKAGVVAPSPAAAGEGASPLQIHSSRKAPSGAIVAIKHRGFWYYIDDADLPSKRAFQQVQMLFASRLFEATKKAQKAPVLTIPVR
jgi:hypothetical protein